MITIKLPITTSNDSFILLKQKNYSGAFRKLYKNIDKIDDKDYINKLILTYSLSSYEINCLKITKIHYRKIIITKDNRNDHFMGIKQK